MTEIKLPLDKNIVKSLKAGDCVLLSGEIITGRDAAHKRLFDSINNGENIPVDLHNQTIYYVGPCPNKDGMAVGSCGPTTSSRMTKYAPTLLENGLLGIIGKGELKTEVVESIKKNCGVYFGAIGGAGAIYAKCVTKSKIVAFEDLGTEAIHSFTIEKFPVIVAIDCLGNSIY